MTRQNANAIQPAQPVGSGDYVVGDGECMNSIARKAGFHWKTIWEHPENSALKRARQDHNVLMPGDRVFIPEKQVKYESRAAGQRHSFVRKGVPSKLKLRLLREGSPQPYANKRYVLKLEGKLIEGKVDGDGNVELAIDPDVSSGTLIVGDPPEQETFRLDLCALDPIDSVRGAQQRLRNLGLLAVEASDSWDEDSLFSLRRFQSLHILKSDDEEPSGVYDKPTRDKLLEIHGC